MRSLIASGLVAACGLVTTTKAQIAKYCPPSADSLCFSVSVPSSSSSSGNNGARDLYFQIQGPSEGAQYMALGQGSQMSGSNIFVVYTDEGGDNVTLSPRLGKGHVEPKYDRAAQVTLLEGSGVSDGILTANVRCSNCASWQGGSMDLSSSNTAWIWAMRSGSPLASNDPAADIRQHSQKNSFTLDLTKAQDRSSSLNPFLAAANNPGVSSTRTANVAGATGTGRASADAVAGASGSGMQKERNVKIAHGVLMGLAFVLVFPLGAVLVRLLKLSVWVHAGVQSFAYAMALAAMGLGVWLICQEGGDFNHYHPIIGLTVLSALLIQILLGHAHHILLTRRSRRTLWADAHIWWGRAVLTLGIINGGLGLMWAGNSRSGEIAYGVIAGVVWVVWMAVGVGSDVKRMRGGGVGGGLGGQGKGTPLREKGSREGSQEEEGVRRGS